MDPNDGCTLIVKKEEDCERQKWIQTRGNLSMVEEKKKDSYSWIRIQMGRGYILKDSERLQQIQTMVTLSVMVEKKQHLLLKSWDDTYD